MKKLVTNQFTYTNPERDKHFTGAQNLVNFINNNRIQKNDIVAINSNERIDTFVLFYYVDDRSPAEALH
jgi:hypothetical protein